MHKGLLAKLAGGGLAAISLSGQPATTDDGIEHYLVPALAAIDLDSRPISTSYPISALEEALSLESREIPLLEQEEIKKASGLSYGQESALSRTDIVIEFGHVEDSQDESSFPFREYRKTLNVKGGFCEDVKFYIIDKPFGEITRKDVETLAREKWENGLKAIPLDYKGTMAENPQDLINYSMLWENANKMESSSEERSAYEVARSFGKSHNYASVGTSIGIVERFPDGVTNYHVLRIDGRKNLGKYNEEDQSNRAL